MFLLLQGCAPAPPPQPDIVLVTIDTLRADAVGAWGAAPSPTPTLDRLAAEGLRLPETMSVSPLTLPAHASLLTGTWPTRHGLRRNGAEALAPDATTLAERLDAAGWSTGAFVSAVVLDRTFGLDQGFSNYDDGPFVAAGSGAVAERDGADTLSRATAWLFDEVAGAPEPFFLWVHLYDPHQPYVARPDSGQTDPYLAEVAHADAQVGQLLEMVRTLNRPRPLVVSVLADHGEGRGDHGEQTHGWFVYRSTMHVPWVLWGAGVPQGEGPALASSVDVMPTLLGLAGLPAEPGLDGRDLLAGPPPADRVVYGETWAPWDGFGFSPLFVGQDAAGRYIRAPRAELYDWRRDPGERAPVDDPAALAAWDQRLESFQPGAGQAPAAPVADTLTQQLAALGYTTPVAAAATALPPDLADPKDHADAYAQVQLAVHAARSVPPEQGVPLLEAALRVYPSAVSLKTVLARGYALLGRPDDALALLQPPGDGEPTVQLQVQVALTMLEAGRLAEVEARLAPIVAARPEEAHARAVLAEALRRDRQPAQALALVQAAPPTQRPDPALLLVEGTALQELGRVEESIPPLQAALAGQPDLEQVRLLLGLALANTGEVEPAAELLETQRQRFGAEPRLDLALARLRLARGDAAGARRLLADLADRTGSLPSWEDWAVWAEAARMVGAPPAEVERAIAGARAAGAPAQALAVLQTPLETPQ